MAKKIIQVPMGEDLLEELNYMSKERGQKRAEFIREACQMYLNQAEAEQLDEVYREGYRRLPEKSAFGRAQVKLAGQILSKETW